MKDEIKNQSIVTEGGPGQYQQRESIIKEVGPPHEVLMTANQSIESDPGQNLQKVSVF